MKCYFWCTWKLLSLSIDCLSCTFSFPVSYFLWSVLSALNFEYLSSFPSTFPCNRRSVLTAPWLSDKNRFILLSFWTSSKIWRKMWTYVTYRVPCFLWRWNTVHKLFRIQFLAALCIWNTTSMSRSPIRRGKCGRCHADSTPKSLALTIAQEILLPTHWWRLVGI